MVQWFRAGDNGSCRLKLAHCKSQGASLTGHLATTRCPSWVRLGPFGVYGSSLLCPEKRTSRDAVTSPFCANSGSATLGLVTGSAAALGVVIAHFGSPGGKRTPERRAPIKKAIARARVGEFGPRIASAALDASLRLAAQQHHKIRALAGLRAQRLVRDDQGRSRHDPGDAIQYVLRNDNAIERGFCAVRVLARSFP